MTNLSIDPTSISIIIMIIISFIVFTIFIINFLLAFKCYGNTTRGRQDESDKALDRRFQKSVRSVRKFQYVELKTATKNFSDDEVIGEGSFGKVYRGTLGDTNEVVAVKRMKAKSDEGMKEYESEVIINSNLSHCNLVRFLGWCHQKDDRLLVYEFFHNTSLDKYIFGESECHLNWDQRYRIAYEIASALSYLHEHGPERVVHRDIKAANVMLDSDFTAKLGDFGIARALKPKKEEHTTCPAGTLGYMDPESLRTGKTSRESDVYSFGALALAIACGRPPADPSLTQQSSNLVKWVWHFHREKRLVDAADKKLDGKFNGEQMERLMSVGLLCAHPEPEDRPTMELVVAMLKMKVEVPPIPEALYGDPLQLEVGSSSGGTSDRTVAGVSSTSSHFNETSSHFDIL